MRVLIINTYYYPAFVGGAEISVKLLAEGMVKAGNSVFVLTTGLADKVYRVNGVIVICLKQKNIFNSYRDSKNIPQFLKVFWHLIDSCNPFYHFKISNLLKRIRPALAHTNNIQGFSPFLWLTIKSQKIPLIHSLRDYYLLCHKCNLYNNDKNCERLCLPCSVTHTIKKGFFKYPDHIVGISNYILNKYSTYLPISKLNSNVIYNATEKNDFEFMKSDSPKLRFGYIGRIAKDKGVEYLVDELAKLGEQKDAFKIIFAGKGDAGFIEQLSHKLENIEFEFLGVAKPYDFYNNIDVLLIPALWNEPFGRIVIESLSYLVPVCQSDRGGLKELFNPANSWIYSPEEGELSILIKHILNNRNEVVEKKKQCGQQAGKFSSEQYIANYLKLYHQFVSIGPEISKARVHPRLT
ncbi:glycosyltransferase family 4 protein [Mucilaginibacter sp.]|jgi:glycosyltransferase involved in cell wall biosynthesis|uniref:glycosyltransferase family 4 protein n=1 Tax=Mucilaginibacter sp. TaxID=1882438 RepID=UPI003567937E